MSASQALMEEVLNRLLADGTRQVWGPGHVLIKDGSESTAIFYILTGEVSVRKGDAQILRMGPGSLLGEMGVLTSQNRVADVVAVTEIEVLRIEAGRFLRAVDDHPAVMRAVIRDLSQKIENMNSQMIQEGSSLAQTALWKSSLSPEELRERILDRPMTSERSCWGRIGVWGDNSCGELEKFNHCRNCPVYAKAGRSLLEREAPEGYLEKWAAVLAVEKEEKSEEQKKSVVVFRLKNDWLALPTTIFKEATTPKVVHRIPHRTNEVVRGLVNVRGELLLMFSLASLLKLEALAVAPVALSRRVYERLAVFEWEGHRWVAPVDEIAGVEAVSAGEIKAVPSTLSGGTGSFATGIFEYKKQRVAILDEELLFFNLTRNFL